MVFKSANVSTVHRGANVSITLRSVNVSSILRSVNVSTIHRRSSILTILQSVNISTVLKSAVASTAVRRTDAVTVLRSTNTSTVLKSVNVSTVPRSAIVSKSSLELSKSIIISSSFHDSFSSFSIKPTPQISLFTSSVGRLMYNSTISSRLPASSTIGVTLLDRSTLKTSAVTMVPSPSFSSVSSKSRSSPFTTAMARQTVSQSSFGNKTGIASETPSTPFSSLVLPTAVPSVQSSSFQQRGIIGSSLTPCWITFYVTLPPMSAKSNETSRMSSATAALASAILNASSAINLPASTAPSGLAISTNRGLLGGVSTRGKVYQSSKSAVTALKLNASVNNVSFMATTSSGGLPSSVTSAPSMLTSHIVSRSTTYGVNVQASRSVLTERIAPSASVDASQSQIITSILTTASPSFASGSFNLASSPQQSSLLSHFPTQNVPAADSSMLTSRMVLSRSFSSINVTASATSVQVEATKSTSVHALASTSSIAVRVLRRKRRANEDSVNSSVALSRSAYTTSLPSVASSNLITMSQSGLAKGNQSTSVITITLMLKPSSTNSTQNMVKSTGMMSALQSNASTTVLSSLVSNVTRHQTPVMSFSPVVSVNSSGRVNGRLTSMTASSSLDSNIMKSNTLASTNSISSLVQNSVFVRATSSFRLASNISMSLSLSNKSSAFVASMTSSAVATPKLPQSSSPFMSRSLLSHISNSTISKGIEITKNTSNVSQILSTSTTLKSIFLTSTLMANYSTRTTGIISSTTLKLSVSTGIIRSVTTGVRNSTSVLSSNVHPVVSQTIFSLGSIRGNSTVFIRESHQSLAHQTSTSLYIQAINFTRNIQSLESQRTSQISLLPSVTPVTSKVQSTKLLGTVSGQTVVVNATLPLNRSSEVHILQSFSMMSRSISSSVYLKKSESLAPQIQSSIRNTVMLNKTQSSFYERITSEHTTLINLTSLRHTLQSSLPQMRSSSPVSASKSTALLQNSSIVLISQMSSQPNTLKSTVVSNRTISSSMLQESRLLQSRLNSTVILSTSAHTSQLKRSSQTATPSFSVTLIARNVSSSLPAQNMSSLAELLNSTTVLLKESQIRTRFSKANISATKSSSFVLPKSSPSFLSIITSASEYSSVFQPRSTIVLETQIKASFSSVNISATRSSSVILVHTQTASLVESKSRSSFLSIISSATENISIFQSKASISLESKIGTRLSSVNISETKSTPVVLVYTPTASLVESKNTSSFVSIITSATQKSLVFQSRSTISLESQIRVSPSFSPRNLSTADRVTILTTFLQSSPFLTNISRRESSFASVSEKPLARSSLPFTVITSGRSSFNFFSIESPVTSKLTTLPSSTTKSRIDKISTSRDSSFLSLNTSSIATISSGLTTSLNGSFEVSRSHGISQTVDTSTRDMLLTTLRTASFMTTKKFLAVSSSPHISQIQSSIKINVTASGRPSSPVSHIFSSFAQKVSRMLTSSLGLCIVYFTTVPGVLLSSQLSTSSLVPSSQLSTRILVPSSQLSTPILAPSSKSLVMSDVLSSRQPNTTASRSSSFDVLTFSSLPTPSVPRIFSTSSHNVSSSLSVSILPNVTTSSPRAKVSDTISSINLTMVLSILQSTGAMTSASRNGTSRIQTSIPPTTSLLKLLTTSNLTSRPSVATSFSVLSSFVASSSSVLMPVSSINRTKSVLMNTSTTGIVAKSSTFRLTTKVLMTSLDATRSLSSILTVSTIRVVSTSLRLDNSSRVTAAPSLFTSSSLSASRSTDRVTSLQTSTTRAFTSTQSLKASVFSQQITSTASVSKSSPITVTAAKSDSSVLKSIQVFSSTSSHNATSVYTTPFVLQTYTLLSTAPALPKSSILPSNTTLLVVPSSSIVPTPATELVSIRILVPVSENVNTAAFQNKIETGLATAFNNAPKRKRRAVQVGSTTVQATSITRQANSQNVNVAFQVSQNNKVVKAQTAADTLNLFSSKGLGKAIGYEVASPVVVVVATVQPTTSTVLPTTVPIPFTQQHLLGMVLTDEKFHNISDGNNRQTFETNMAAYYKRELPVKSGTVVFKVTHVKHEGNKVAYLEFYVTVNNVLQNGSAVAAFFKTKDLSAISALISMPVKILPYALSEIKATTANHIKTVLQPVSGTVNFQATAVQNDLVVKLEAMYRAAKYSGSNRKKRALSSITVTIVTVNSKNNNQGEVIFYILDQGTVLTASSAVTILDRLTTSRMGAILGYQVITAPVPLVTIPTPATTSTKELWIIGVVVGSLAVFVIVILILMYWRWRVGGPQRKVMPAEIEMIESRHVPAREKQLQGAPSDISRFAQGETVLGRSLQTTSFAAPIEETRGKGRLEPRESIRRKVQVPRLNTGQRPPLARDIGRQRTAYQSEIDEDEEEEDEEEDEDDEDEEEEESEEEVIVHRPKSGIRAVRPVSAHIQKSASRPGSSRVSAEPETLEGDSDDEPLIRPQVERPLAAELPPMAKLKSAKEIERYPPVRFRATFDPSSTAPTGALPPLNQKGVALISYKELDLDPDLQQKAELERSRNKLRQRQKLQPTPRTEEANGKAPSPREENWNKAQSEIGAILDPIGSKMPPYAEHRGKSKRHGRRRKYRRKNKVDIAQATGEEKEKQPPVKLNNFVDKSDLKQMPSEEKTDEKSSDTESEISITEARKRMHDLLDDAFSLMQPFSKILDQSLGAKKAIEPEITARTMPETGAVPLPQSRPVNPYLPPRYAGMPPVYPEPFPSHGRASIPHPGSHRRRLLAQTYGKDPFRQDLGDNTLPPVITKDPVVVMDPMDRQRYANQRMGFPVYGRTPASFSYPYDEASGPGVYITPVQQQPDGLGNIIWSPYATERAMDPLSSNEMPPIPNTLDGSSYLSAIQSTPLTSPYVPPRPKQHRTTIDNDVSGLGNSPADSTPQPLIRAIKEELLRLSQSAQGRTKIQELPNV